MTEGLLFVYTEPGSVTEEEFHDWYDGEHAPLRMTVPGIRTGRRYRASDGRTPTWLALYDLDLAVLETPEYRALRANRSARERDVVDRLAVLDRRVYSLVEDRGPVLSEPAPVVVCVSLTSAAPDGLAEWYSREHIPLLLAIPGWRRIRRFRRVQGSGEDFLALHEIDDPAVFSTDAYLAATSTPWRAEVMSAVTARDRREFTFHRDFPGHIP